MTKLDNLEKHKQEICRMYSDKKVSVGKLGQMFDCSGGLMSHFLKTRCNVKIRGISFIFDQCKDDVLRMYNSGASMCEIAENLNISCETACSYAKKLELNSGRNWTGKGKLEKYDKEIIEMYLGGVGSINIARKYNCSPANISKLLQRNGVNSNLHKNKYSCNYHFFDKIDSEKKAYIFGFILADGSNNRKRLQIQICDLDVLEQIRASIEYTGPIRVCKKRKKCYKQPYSLDIHSGYLTDQLTKIGVMPNKTFKVTFPPEDILSKHLFFPFLLGYHDGDGCFHINKRGKLQCSMCGTENLLLGIQRYLMEYDIISSVRAFKSIFVLNIKQDDVYSKLIHYLYDDATIYMQRKYDIIKHLL